MGVWGIVVSILAFYNGAATLTLEIYGKVRRGGRGAQPRRRAAPPPGRRAACVWWWQAEQGAAYPRQGDRGGQRCRRRSPDFAHLPTLTPHTPCHACPPCLQPLLPLIPLTAAKWQEARNRMRGPVGTRRNFDVESPEDLATPQ